MKSLFYILFFVVIFSGCSKVGIDFQKPSVSQIPKDWRDNNQTGVETLKWWEIFHDKTLNTLITKAYRQNLDLRTAAMRILQARAVLGITEGYKYPQQQSINSSALFGYKNSKSYSALDLNFDLGWEMDIWGMYARGIESSQALLYASMMSYNDIAVSITAEVARNYIEYRVAQERIHYAKKNIKIQEKVLHITQVQYNAGNVSELDMQQAKTQLYLTKSSLPALEIQKIKNRNALAVLLGMTPNEVEKILDEDGKNDKYTPSVVLDEDFKVSAAELQRRPDIQAAEYVAHSKSAKIGLSEAKLYPHFFLFGTIGIGASDITGSWNSFGDGIYVQAGPGFRWDIFQYGRIKNEIKLRDAEFQESLIAYNKKVLEAVRDVSNAINGYRYLLKEYEYNQKATDATQRAYELSVAQYQNGLVSYQRLLTSIEKLTKSQDLSVQIKGNIALDVVLLYKALGGGWKIADEAKKIKDTDKQTLIKHGYWKEEELNE